MQDLADHHIHWLENLTFAYEKPWFDSGRDGCFKSLIILVARQANLKHLNLNGAHPEPEFEYCLTDDQQQ